MNKNKESKLKRPQTAKNYPSNRLYEHYKSKKIFKYENPDLTGKPDLKASFKHLDPDIKSKIEDRTDDIFDRLTEVKKYTPNPKKIKPFKELCPGRPTISRPKSARGKESSTPFFDRLYWNSEKHNKHKESLKAKQDEILSQGIGATFTPVNNLEEYFAKNPDQKSRILTPRQEKKPFEHFLSIHHKSPEDYQKLEEARQQLKEERAMAFNQEVPVTKMYSMFNTPVQGDKKPIWGYSFHNDNYKNENQMNVFDMKNKENSKSYKYFFDIQKNIKGKTFLKEVIKNGTTHLNEEKEEKLKELNTKWYTKENKKFECFFYPQFGKVLTPIVRDGKVKGHTMKARSKSKSKPDDISERLYSNNKKWMMYENGKLNKSESVKSQLDNYYPWQMESICKVVKGMPQSKKEMMPLASGNKTIAEMGEILNQNN